MIKIYGILSSDLFCNDVLGTNLYLPCKNRVRLTIFAKTETVQIKLMRSYGNYGFVIRISFMSELKE